MKCLTTYNNDPDKIFIGCYWDSAFEDVEALCVEMGLKSLRQGTVCSDCYYPSISKPCYLNKKDYAVYKKITEKILSDMDPLFWGEPSKLESEDPIDTEYLLEEMSYQQ